jgi:hypothetical protein
MIDVDKIIAYENGEMSDEEIIEFFQELVNGLEAARQLWPGCACLDRCWLRQGEVRMRKITKHDIVTAGLKAIEEGRLAVQHGLGCYYDAGKDEQGRRIGCIIGVALNGEEIERVLDHNYNGSGVAMLNDVFIEFEDEDTYLLAERLQRIHDDAANYANYGDDPEKAVDRIEKVLLELKEKGV